MRICRMIVSRGMEQVDLSDEMQQRDGCEPEPAQQVPPPHLLARRHVVVSMRLRTRLTSRRTR